jgi:hypothetical protein
MKRDTILLEEAFNYVKENPEATVEDAKKDILKGYNSIPFVYKYAIVILGILAVLAALAGIIMIIIDPTGTRNIPESLVAIGSASVGALVGIFAPIPDSDGKSGE